MNLGYIFSAWSLLRLDWRSDGPGPINRLVMPSPTMIHPICLLLRYSNRRNTSYLNCFTIESCRRRWLMGQSFGCYFGGLFRQVTPDTKLVSIKRYSGRVYCICSLLVLSVGEPPYTSIALVGAPWRAGSITVKFSAVQDGVFKPNPLNQF